MGKNIRPRLKRGVLKARKMNFASYFHALIWVLVAFFVATFTMLHLFYPEDTLWISETISSLGSTLTHNGLPNVASSITFIVMLLGTGVLVLVLAVTSPGDDHVLQGLLAATAIGAFMAMFPVNLYYEAHLAGSGMLFGFGAMFIIDFYYIYVKSKLVFATVFITTLLSVVYAVLSLFVFTWGTGGLAERILFVDLVLWLAIIPLIKHG